MSSSEDAAPPVVDPTVPHAARIWNYWMGGKDNYESDVAAGDAVAQVYPDIVTMARESRRFLIRVVSHLAREVGIRQFLDIGTGLPTMQNTHEVAQRIAPESRIVYVDNDPLVLTHARALLVNTSAEGATSYVHADYHDPERILAGAADTLDLTEPVTVMFMGVLGYEPELTELRRIVGRVLAALPSGSHLVMWDGTDTGEAVVEGGEKLIEAGGVPYHLRGPDELGRCFEGLELVEPGMVPITLWRPEEPAAGAGAADAAGADAPRPIDAYGAVGRKP
ncbi:SAM-dependent methyltransferase [Streptomyces sp. WMMC500]|uniref:SAM-dependent methyltransferase n=1 Tax=Streptomyces sp. WMMC500 TaxID=3015154 RepID=UPI00248CF1DD|nr:SAM-dependent methyltransferase [Streptomyces sp. WMMC500]WBB58440.1 SAM-dependent methyltransferase [Streptomyces sp. WMMC500]